jgi:hypothetical protein
VAVSRSALIEAVQPLQQSGFGLGQQVGHGDSVKSQGIGETQGDVHVDADHRATGGEAKLAGDPQQDVPRLPAFEGAGFVQVSGAASVTGAGGAVVAALAAISRPAAEVPSAAGLEAFPSARTASWGAV